MWEIRYNFGLKQYFDDIVLAQKCLEFTRKCGNDGFIYRTEIKK